MLHSFCKSLKPCHLKKFISTSSLRNAQFFDDAEDALKDISDGATIFAGGFFVCGVPENCFQALMRLGVKNLTVAAITSGINHNGIERIIAASQVKRLITTYVGMNKESVRQYLNGEMEVEFVPQGNLVERIRAGGAGIPAFFTSTGVGTLVQRGGIPIKFTSNGRIEIDSQPKEVKQFNGKSYLLENAISADFAFVKAWKADRKGNLIFRKSAQNINPEVARAAKCTIAEVEEIVEAGEIDPDHIHLPHIYVDRVFKGKKFDKKFGTEKVFSTEEKPKSKGDLKREKIARRAVLELKDGMCVNLGFGVPLLATCFLNPAVDVSFQSEIGILRVGPYPKKEELDLDLINAGAESTSVLKGASFFSTGETFAMIRGGHLDWTILGAMQVSKYGDLANWMVPGKMIKGMGGAMDLVSSSKTRVMVTMEHTEKEGAPKIVNECSLPLTGKQVVDMIVTEMGVFQVDRSKGGLTLTEIAADVTLDQVKASTGCEFTVSKDLKTMTQA